MRVLLFTDADVFAGTERHMLDLAVALKAEGVQASIACPFPAVLAERAKGAGIATVVIQKQGLIDWAAVRIVRRLLKSGTVDVVHAHNGRTALAAALAVSLARRGRCVATQHFLEPHHVSLRGPKAVVSHMAHGWVSRTMHAFSAISNAVREEMLHRDASLEPKITTVLNGMSVPDAQTLPPIEQVRAELGLAEGTPLIVCAARLEPEKDVASLLEAMQSVQAAHPQAVCVVAGDGSQKAALQQRIEEAGLQNAVRLLGFRSDVLGLINAADIFVLPSPAEPFGLVLLEAMALGKPVIATQAGGPLEIVVPDETGVLVPPRDANALGTALCRLLEDTTAREEMGRKGRARFEATFNARRMACETIEVYRRALDNRL